MWCRIIKDKTSGEEFLIPGCYSVSHHWHLDMPDREIIKTYCTCHPKKQEKYEVHTKDEVKAMIETLEKKIWHHKKQLEEMENELDGIKSEVFMLNTVEVV